MSWDFWLRERISWSWSARPPSGGQLPLTGEAGARVAELGKTYDLSRLPQVCGSVEMAESLYVLDLADRFLTDLPAGRCLDVGSKYGAYLPGLATFRPGWDAVEVDAHRRYWSGHTRRAVGEGIAAALPDCRFIAGNVRELTGSYAAVTWFLPFLFEEPQRAWGLPLSLLQPVPTLQHVISLVAPGGILLVLNQGGEEAIEQGRLFGELGIRAEILSRLESPLSPFQKARYGWRWRRPVE